MSNKPFRPLKAVSEELGFHEITYPKVVSIKMDGVYGLVKDSALLGRSLKPFKNKWIGGKLGHNIFSGFVGEIMNADIWAKDQELFMNRQSLCRDTTSKTNKINAVDWDFVWVLFDNIGDGSEEFLNKPYWQRMFELAERLENMPQARFITTHNYCGIEYSEFLVYDMAFLVPKPLVVNSAEEAEAIYEEALAIGFEGIVLRDVEGIFKCGRSTAKSQEFVRAKPKADEEIVVVSFEEAMINNNETKINELGYTERSSHQENKIPSGMVGAIIGINPATGKEVKIGAGRLNHEDRKHIFENQEDYIGLIAKYRSMNTGVKDKPRHPRWIGWRSRSDMDDSFEDFVKDSGVYVK